MSSSNDSTTSSTESIERAFCREKCLRDHLAFTRYFFKKKHNNPFIINWHHQLIADKIQAVIDGQIKNLIINVPPGSSKTEEAVINLIARGLAVNPYARFLHLSYSDDLALLNSQSARDIIESDEYQAMWPLKISMDSKSKKRWNVMVDGNNAGGVYATSLGGQITGFRAGHMAPGFTGAIIIDDPLKPEDSFSKTKLDAANRKLLTTVKSRRANPDVPIIVIMQRIAENDPSAFIKQGSLGGEWEHLVIPALIDDAYVAALPEQYRSLITTDTVGRHSYWPYKEPTSELLSMEIGDGTNKEGAKMSRHVFSSQYMQNPVALGGNIIKGSWFKKVPVIPKIKYRKIYVDTAMKTAERNDYSVFEEWGLAEDGKIYLLDMLRGKWEAPELEARAKAFWAKSKAKDVDRLGVLRKMIVEAKAAGTGLVQKIRLLNAIPIEEIEPQKDKLTRVMDIVGYIESGMVCIPESEPWVHDFLQECEAFTADNSHAHDDQVDALCYAVSDLLAAGNLLETWRRLA